MSVEAKVAGMGSVVEEAFEVDPARWNAELEYRLLGSTHEPRGPTEIHLATGDIRHEPLEPIGIE
jgi:hypothetical protein